MYQVYENLIQGLSEKGFESVDNWFTSDHIQCLRKSLQIHHQKDHFHEAHIGKQDSFQRLESFRKDQVFWLSRADQVECEQMFFVQIDEFITYLNRTCYTSLADSEFHYALYEPGSFYKKHVDQFKNDDRRQYSMVAYLTAEWKPGDGGELVIYPNDEEKIIIEPIPGRVVFFKSNLYHEVLETHIPRMSITGWLKRA